MATLDRKNLKHIFFKESIHIFQNEDVVGAAPTCGAPTSFEWSAKLLPTKV